MIADAYRCPFCSRSMTLCNHGGLFWVRHPNGLRELRQLDRDGVEIDPLLPFKPAKPTRKGR